MKRILLFSLIGGAIIAVALYVSVMVAFRYLIDKVASLNPQVSLASSQTIRNVTYCRPYNNPQLLDIYMPAANRKAYPAIIYIHGGSWVSGSKDVEALSAYLPALTNTGFVIASINYRLVPTYTFPAQIEDVKCAIRFLRANASTYRIDPNHIGVIGESAGGYLAAFSGVTGNNTLFKSTEYLNISDAVEAVVDISGPTDFTAESASYSSRQIARNFLGAASPAAASVTNYVSSHAAPFLIIHGKDDQVVPLNQSQRLYSALQIAHVPAQLLVVSNAGHSLNNTNTDPSLQTSALDILHFFRQFLGN